MTQQAISPSIPDDFDPWRVEDETFARAYSRTGDRGRSYIKSCIAALYRQSRTDGPVSSAVSSMYGDGLARLEEITARQWFVLAVSPEISSPSMLVSAVMPALAARIPLAFAVRPKGRGGWPRPLLAALELCGVEHAFSPPLDELKRCLSFLAREYGPGGVACLGPDAFERRIRAAIPHECAVCGLIPPSMGLLEAPGVEWNREALDFCLAGTVMQVHSDPAALAAAGHGAVFAPARFAPASARLVIGPGREFLWDWPDLPVELFFARRLVYS